VLNQDLFEDPKDVTIARLKTAINAFKKYDEKRKKYYQSLAIKVGELESYVEEMSDTQKINKHCVNQRVQLHNLQEKVDKLTNQLDELNKKYLAVVDENKNLIAKINEQNV
jgi:uncharacterized coiled-coil protein SlyX